jgi:hypothetical protein
MAGRKRHAKHAFSRLAKLYFTYCLQYIKKKKKKKKNTRRKKEKNNKELPAD